MLNDADLQALIDDVEGDFPSSSSYAKLYRHYGMQVIPANAPGETEEWKRPHYKLKWKQFQKELMKDDEFNALYGNGGSYVSRVNMGLITGVSPKRIVVVDLDSHKNPKAEIWWHGIHVDHNGGVLSQTVAQRTGGGGEQHFFISPEGWTCPTNKNPEWGVDSRGYAGFAMLPPSKHESGKNYEWMDGQAPWECDFEVMPKWMCDEIDAILGIGTSTSTHGERVKTSTPNHQIDGYGNIIDGREDKMTRMIFRAILDMYRDCPIIPSEIEQRDAMKRCFEEYLDHVKSRINEPGTEKHILLNREGRGIDLFKQKWRATMRQWDTKISDESKRPWTKPERPSQQDNFEETSVHAEVTSEKGETYTINPPETAASIFTLMRTGAIMEMKDPEYLIDNLIPDESFGFVIGVPGCLKSFITLDMSLSIAAGLREWMGYKIKKQGPVVYVTSEGLGDIKRRIKAWEKKTKKKVDSLPFYLIPDSMNMMQSADVMKLARTVKAAQEQEGAPPALVVIDTASRVLPGADENLQKDMTLFVKACDYIRQSFKCAVLAVHHLSRNGAGTMRGSTVFDGAADFILLVEREAGQMFGSISAKKIKAASDGWTIEFAVKEVEVVPGIEPKTSLYIEFTKPKSSFDPGFGGEQETGFFYAGGMKIDIHLRDKILNDIDDAWNSQRPWSIAHNMRQDVRHSYRQIKKSFGKKITDMKAKDIIDSLIDNEWIEEGICNFRSKLKGLKIKNDPRNPAEVSANNCGSGLATSESFADDYNDL